MGQRVLVLAAERTVWLRGFAVRGAADDSRLNLAGQVVRVTGTKTYATALGTTNTVPVVEPFDVAPVLKLWRERKEAKP